MRSNPLTIVGEYISVATRTLQQVRHFIQSKWKWNRCYREDPHVQCLQCLCLEILWSECSIDCALDFVLIVIWKSCYTSNSTNDITQHNSAPYNMTCQRYSHLSAMNTSIPTALSSLSQSVEIFSSLNVIALQMIKLVSKILASFYAFGFCVTVLAFVGFLGSPGGRMRTMISAILSCVSRIPQVAHYANPQSSLRSLFMGWHLHSSRQRHSLLPEN